MSLVITPRSVLPTSTSAFSVARVRPLVANLTPSPPMADLAFTTTTSLPGTARVATSLVTGVSSVAIWIPGTACRASRTSSNSGLGPASSAICSLIAISRYGDTPPCVYYVCRQRELQAFQRGKPRLISMLTNSAQPSASPSHAASTSTGSTGCMTSSSRSAHIASSPSPPVMSAASLA